jgi:hypothetical protein
VTVRRRYVHSTFYPANTQSPGSRGELVSPVASVYCSPLPYTYIHTHAHTPQCTCVSHIHIYTHTNIHTHIYTDTHSTCPHQYAHITHPHSVSCSQTHPSHHTHTPPYLPTSAHVYHTHLQHATNTHTHTHTHIKLIKRAQLSQTSLSPLPLSIPLVLITAIPVSPWPEILLSFLPNVI